MARRWPPSVEDDAKLARMLQEQEEEQKQQQALGIVLAELWQEEKNQASQRHYSSESSSRHARGGVRRPHSSFDSGSSSAREYQRSFDRSDAALAQSIYNNYQKSFHASDMAIARILQDEKSHDMSDEAIARVLQAEEEEMAEQQRQEKLGADSARANSGPSDMGLPPLGAARHTYDDNTRHVHSDYRSDGFRYDDVDSDDGGGFRGEQSGGHTQIRRSLSPHGSVPFSAPHSASSHHREVAPDLERLQNSNYYEDLLQLEEIIGNAPSAGLPQHTINSLPVTQYRQPALTSTPRAAAAAQSARDSENSKCSICLQQFARAQRLRTLPCLHCFHKHCIDKWFEENCVCPVCRTDVGSALTARR